MFVNFSEEVRHLLKQATRERNNLNHPYVGSEHFFLAVLKENKINKIFNKHQITYDKFKEKLINTVGIGSNKSEFILYTPLLKRALENAVIEAREQRSKYVNPEIIIITILDEEVGVANEILKKLNVNIDNLYYDLKKNNRKKKNKKLLLEEIGTDINKLAKDNKLDPVIGRENEIEKTIGILLRRKKNNPILIGPAGVGKTAIVEGIARLIESGKCPKYLKNKRIISLNIYSLVSGTKYRGEFEEKMKNIIKELEENEDIILFIDEIHTIVGAGGAEGAIDASNILKPALARGNIKIIGATTIDEYKKYIEPDTALARRFQCIFIEEPDKKTVVKILNNIKFLYERYHNIKISSKLINEIVEKTSIYLTNRYEPDRSIDILDEACVMASNTLSSNEILKKELLNELNVLSKKKKYAIKNKNFKIASELKTKERKLEEKINKINIGTKKITYNDIITVIKNKGNLKLMFLEDKNTYESLEKRLNNKVLGQKKAINKLIKLLIRKNLLLDKKTYSVTISGSEGSGKTYLAETFLKELLNSKNILKIDLSEYKDSYTISKLIGTTAGYLGYDNKNNILEKVRTNPSMGIIVENFDMGCEEVQNIFKKIINNGFIEDGSGRKINFLNTILIITKTEDENKNLGFNTNLQTSENKEDSLIKLEKIDIETKNNIIRQKIDELLLKYDYLKVDKSYYKYLINKLEKEHNLKNIVKYIKEDIEEKMVDSVLNGNKNILIAS